MSSAVPWGKGPVGPYLVRVRRLSTIKDMPSEWEALTLTQARRIAWCQLWSFAARGVVVYRVRGEALRAVFSMNREGERG